MKELESDSTSRITTLKITGGCIKDVADVILTNLEQVEDEHGALYLSNEKFVLLF